MCLHSEKALLALSSLSLLIVFLVPACTGGGSDARVALKYRGGHIVATLNGRRSEMFLVEEFKRRHPAIDVIYEASPADWREIGGKIMAEFASGDAPDVLESVGGLVEKGLLVNLDPLIERDYDEIGFGEFYDIAVEPSPFDSHRYALPAYGLLVVVLFYNEDVFDAAGVSYPDESWTWETFIDAAQKLTLDTDGDGHPDVYGCNYFLNSVSGQGPMMWSFGGDFLNEDLTEITVNSPACIKAFQVLHDLRWKYNVIPRFSEGREGTPTVMMFSAGRYAMEVTHAGLVRLLHSAGVGMRWDIALVPKGPEGRFTRFGSYNLSIASTTKHPEEAWELLKFLASPFAMRTRLKMGSAHFTPPRRSVAESPDYLGIKPPEHPEVFIESLKFARLDRCQLFIGGGEIYRAIQTELDLVWLDKLPVEEAVRRAETNTVPLLKRYLRERL